MRENGSDAGMLLSEALAVATLSLCQGRGAGQTISA